MKSAWIVWIALLVLGAVLEAQQKYSGGIVYGPKAAFNISAPDGWVLNNESGVNQGQPCVLYPKGESWTDARTVMYAKIASTEFEDVNAFVAWAIKGMMKTHGKPKEKIASGKTKDGRDYFINRKSLPAKPRTAVITSSTSTLRQKLTLSGNAWVTSNFRTP